MNRLPGIRITQVPAFQKERLARWLREWELESALKEDELAGRPDPYYGMALRSGLSSGDTELPQGLAASIGANVGRDMEQSLAVPGQIRLLRPTAGAARERPVYVAVLADGYADDLLIAPYGRFSEPALPGELLTGRDVACLRVLCLWNGRWVARSQAEDSWLVDNMAETELQDALDVWKTIDSGDGLPPDLKKRTGAPVQHPADPRHDYRAEEASAMDSLGGGTEQCPRRIHVLRASA